MSTREFLAFVAAGAAFLVALTALAEVRQQHERHQSLSKTVWEQHKDHEALSCDLRIFAAEKGKADAKAKVSVRFCPFDTVGMRKAWQRGWLQAKGIDGLELERLIENDMAGYVEQKE